MPKISAVIITYNEERNIGKCLESIQGLVDDIVVVDSYSTDNTEEIVKSFGARFIQHPFEGHIEQKNWAITQAKYPHILSLDADEVPSDRLKDSIKRSKENWTHDGYYFNRLTNYCGKWIRHTSWYPARKLRLWDSRKGEWGGINPHDKFIMKRSSTKKFLRGDLYHYSYYSINEHVQQINKFSTIVAQAYFKANIRANFINIAIHPVWRLFRDYIIKLGFLDGFYGLIISVNASHETFLKYVKLRDLYREKRRKEQNVICFFNSVKTWGGGEKWHFEMANRLHLKGKSVRIFTNHKSELKTRTNESAIPISSIRINNLSFLNPYKIIKLAIIFRKLKVRVIIMNLSADLKVAGIAAKLAGIPHIIYRRGSAIPIRNSILNRFLFRKVVHQVIANSNETQRTILSRNPKMINLSKIQIIYNGINLPRFDEAELTFRYKPKANQVVIGNAGRLVKQKGQKYLIDLALNLKKRKIDFKILIAGEGKMENELRSLISKNGLVRNFEFSGFVEDMKGFMQSIDIFVLTSIWEGFGYVLVEAMACNKPVVAFEISSNPEIIEDTKTGYLVPAFDMEAMTDKVVQLIKDKKLREELGKRGRERVENMFSIDKTQENLENLLMDYSEIPYD
ncbi:MAG: glycosyltransferase [Bacteroidales bacterium]|nr:glycosyltransferase [Bacteroidales bacterium]MCF8389307.1 glycosyltransferase [Bacteroidales bacterium]